MRKFGNSLFGSPIRRRVERFGYENAATFKVLPTWPFSSLSSWMDRRKRITEGESLDTALPQLATASDRWTTQLDTPRANLIVKEFLFLGASVSNVFARVHRVMQCWWVWWHARIQMYLIFSLNNTFFFFFYFFKVHALPRYKWIELSC